MFDWNPRKWSATRTYVTLQAVTALGYGLVFAASMVYYINTIGMTPLQLVLIGTMLEVTIFVCEVPTGVVADVYSRRLSIAIGCGLIGLGFGLQALLPTFAAALLAQVLWGLGYTFTSGATQAWITDELGEEAAGPLFLRGARLGSLVGIAATLAAIALGSLHLQLPLLLGSLGFLALVALLIAFMPESGFQPLPRDQRNSWQQMRHTFGEGWRTVRTRPTLQIILGVGLFLGLFSEGFDRLSDNHLLQSFALPDFGGLQAVAWLNALGLIGQFISLLVLRQFEKRLDLRQAAGLNRLILLVTALLTGCLLAFALVGQFALAVVLNWAVNTLRTLLGPLDTTWINQHVDSQVRATVISMRGQVDALGQIAGGPPVGLVGERWGVRVALTASALLLAPALPLLGWAARRGATST